MSLVDSAPVLFQVGPNKVLRISRDLILKCGPFVLPSEAKAMEIARENTTILLPQIYRSFQVPNRTTYYETTGYIVMDYIYGENLGDCWKQLDTKQKDDVICQTAMIISQLQSIEISSAGPIGGGPCIGRLFSDYGAGPFNSGSEMEA